MCITLGIGLNVKYKYIYIHVVFFPYRAWYKKVRKSGREKKQSRIQNRKSRALRITPPVSIYYTGCNVIYNSEKKIVAIEIRLMVGRRHIFMVPGKTIEEIEKLHPKSTLSEHAE